MSTESCLLEALSILSCIKVGVRNLGLMLVVLQPYPVVSRSGTRETTVTQVRVRRHPKIDRRAVALAVLPALFMCISDIWFSDTRLMSEKHNFNVQREKRNRR